MNDTSPNRSSVALTDTHVNLIYAIVLALVLTGVAWLYLRYFGGTRGEFGWEPSRWQMWWLRLHGGAAALGLILIGSLIGRHIVPAIPRGRNLITGLTLATTLMTLSVSGYLLYYLVEDDARRWTSIIHWVVGLALVPAFALHLTRSRWRRRGTTRLDSPG